MIHDNEICYLGEKSIGLEIIKVAQKLTHNGPFWILIQNIFIFYKDQAIINAMNINKFA